MLGKFKDAFAAMFEDSSLHKPQEVMVRVGGVGLVADGEIELFARELLGKGDANKE